MNIKVDPNEDEIFKEKKLKHQNLLQIKLQDQLTEKCWILRAPDELGIILNESCDSMNEGKSEFIFLNMTEHEAAHFHISKPSNSHFSEPQPDPHDQYYQTKMSQYEERRNEYETNKRELLRNYERDLQRNFKFVFSIMDQNGSKQSHKQWATLFDLPCRIEAQKTFDNYKTDFKSNDICQVFWIHDKRYSPQEQPSWRDQLLAQFPKWLFNTKKDFIHYKINSGITPPSKQIKRKIQSKNQLNKLGEIKEESLKEVVELINLAINGNLPDKHVLKEDLVLLREDENKELHVTEENIDWGEFSKLLKDRDRKRKNK